MGSFPIFQKIYAFIFECAGSSLLHTGFLKLQRAGLLFSGAHASYDAVASLVEENLSCWSGLLAHGLQQLQQLSSVVVCQGLQTTGLVVVHRSSCPVACRIFQDQRLNLCFLHWQVDSQPLDHQGSPLFLFKKIRYNSHAIKFTLLKYTTL